MLFITLSLLNADIIVSQDSGGFQMVSLVELSEVTEEGVRFKSPYDGKEILLTPEKSISIQNSLGNELGYSHKAMLYLCYLLICNFPHFSVCL